MSWPYLYAVKWSLIFHVNVVMGDVVWVVEATKPGHVAKNVVTWTRQNHGVEASGVVDRMKFLVGRARCGQRVP